MRYYFEVVVAFSCIVLGGAIIGLGVSIDYINYVKNKAVNNPTSYQTGKVYHFLKSEYDMPQIYEIHSEYIVTVSPKGVK